MATTLYCIYHLDNILLCDKTTLGCEFDMSLNGLKGKLCLPKLKPVEPEFANSNKNYKPFLFSPFEEIEYKNLENDKNRECYWGRVFGFPDGLSYVYQVVFKFDKVGKRNTQKIYEQIKTWVDKFVELYDILEKTAIHYAEADSCINVPPAEVYILNNEKAELMENKNEAVFSTNLTIIDKGTDKCIFEETARLASKTEEISFEFKQYQYALKSFANKDYSKCVIDGAIALEKVLLSAIKQSYMPNDPKYMKDSKKHRMLGGYFQWAIERNLKLPTQDYQVALRDLRNDIVHNGKIATKKEAQKFLNDTRLYLDKYGSILS